MFSASGDVYIPPSRTLLSAEGTRRLHPFRAFSPEKIAEWRMGPCLKIYKENIVLERQELSEGPAIFGNQRISVCYCFSHLFMKCFFPRLSHMWLQQHFVPNRTQSLSYSFSCLGLLRRNYSSPILKRKPDKSKELILLIKYH